MQNTPTLGTKQVCIVKRHGKRVGLYHYRMVNGEYPNMWHRDTVPALLADIKAGRAVEYIPKSLR